MRTVSSPDFLMRPRKSPLDNRAPRAWSAFCHCGSLAKIGARERLMLIEDAASGNFEKREQGAWNRQHSRRVGRVVAMDHPSFNFQRWRAGPSENALRPTIGALSYEARHATELARVSWYLMVPPVIPPTREMNKSARLKEWTLRRVRSRSDIGGGD
jgi:hypothetical protein